MKQAGFTLIEMSVVILIIALLIGGIVVGASMVDQAELRQFSSQIERYRAAVYTFRLSYNALPGDITAAKASQFGFATRAGTATHGDGNGRVESWGNWMPNQCGEPSLFWSDLSRAKLIPGEHQGTDNVYGSGACGAPDTESIVPTAKIGDTNIVMMNYQTDRNYFTLCGGVGQIGVHGQLLTNAGGQTSGLAAISGRQAKQLDEKMDDGMPFSGKMTARNYCAGWGVWPTLATAAAPTTGVCVSDAADNPYNHLKATGGESLSCILRIGLD